MHSIDHPAAPLGPAQFVLFFTILWFFVAALLATVGGWSKLARRFRAADPKAVPVKLTSGRIGGVSYNNCLYVGYSDEGILVRIMFPFRFMHPPLFIPWRAIQSYARRKFLFFFTWDTFTVDAGSSVTIGLRRLVPDEYLSRLSDLGEPPPVRLL